MTPTRFSGLDGRLSSVSHHGIDSLRGSAAAVLRVVVAITMLFTLSACVTVGGGPQERPRDASQYNAELGAKYLERGELEQARIKLEKALEQDDENALAHRVFAQLQQRVGNGDSARSHFRTAIQLQPDDAEHRNGFGIFLCQESDFDEAEIQFVKAAENPYYRTPEFALDNAGLCMLDAGRNDAAEKYLRQALRTNPKFANSYLHMAELMRRKERLTVSDAYFQRYLAYGQQTPESLLLGVGIKRDLGDLRTAEQYADQLLNEFPASLEAGEYLSRPLR